MEGAVEGKRNNRDKRVELGLEGRSRKEAEPKDNRALKERTPDRLLRAFLRVRNLRGRRFRARTLRRVAFLLLILDHLVCELLRCFRRSVLLLRHHTLRANVAVFHARQAARDTHRPELPVVVLQVRHRLWCGQTAL